MKKFRHQLLFLALIAITSYTLTACSAGDKGKVSKITEILITSQESLKFTDGPPSLPKGAQIVVIEGNPAKPGMFTLRLKFPKNYQIPAHSHPVVEHITVISGSISFGMGDKLNKSNVTKVPQGGLIIIPAKKNHFAYTENEPVVLQLHSQGPFEITYVNKKDDPRGPSN